MGWENTLQRATEALGVVRAEYIRSVMEKHYEAMATPELHSLFWEAYKETENIRPRWVAFDDRETMLRWFVVEMFPWQIESRRAEYDRENAWYAEQEAAIRREALAAQMDLGEQIVLEMAYSTAYDHLDPRL